MYNKTIGNLGEDLACKFLEKNGYKIICRNVSVGHKEIDIIAKIGKEIAFIEVKTRTSEKFGEAVDAMSKKKSDFLRRAVSIYIRKNNINPDIVGIELVAIDLDFLTKTAKIKQYKDLL